MHTKFQDIKVMNNAFGNPEGDVNNPNWTKIDRQFRIIEKEFEELKLAIERRQIHGVGGIRDGIADLNVTNLGLAHIIGVDSDDDMDEVFNSNMSKFCANDEELKASVGKYAKIGVEVYAEGEYPQVCIKSAKEQTGTNGETYTQGKFLKGINFKEPNLAPYPTLSPAEMGKADGAEDDNV